MSTTDNGVPVEDLAGDDTFDAADAFSKLWNKDAATPSNTKAEDDEDEQSEEDTEGSETETETEGEDGDEQSTEDAEDEGEEEEANDDNVVVKDEYKVKVPVDGEDKEFSIGDLKRLAGQEASLTRKSQEVATKRKQIDTQAATHVAALKVLIERADKRFEPYANLDLLTLSRNAEISNEELTAIREARDAAFADKQFLTQELGAFTEALQKQRASELREQAAETVKVLSDPEKGIPGFSEKLYGEMMQFATDQGVPPEAVNEIVDPISLKILHMAMQYARGAKKVKVETDPKAKSKKDKQKAPKRIVKSISNTDSTKEALGKGKPEAEQAAMKRLRQSGSSEDAVAAFAARFARDAE
jgi:hypothetical protein